MLQTSLSSYWTNRFRSRAESEVAFFLDNLGLDWVYRPKMFLLKNGEQHGPDFYLPQLRLWMDVMDHIDKISIPQVKGFCALIKDGRIDTKLVLHEKRKRSEVGDDYTDYLLIGPDGAALVEYQYRPYRRLPVREHNFVSEATFTACRRCSRWYFVSHSGDTTCRHCGQDAYLHSPYEASFNLEKGALIIDAMPVAIWVEHVLSDLDLLNA